MDFFMKNWLARIFFSITFLVSLSLADFMHGTFYNPGIKIGYRFGKNGGFTIGTEHSLTYAVSVFYTGVVGGIEFNVKQRKLIEYWEIEGGAALFGVAFGGEWNQGHHGTIRLFSGTIGFFSFKHIFAIEIDEIAFVGKYPFEVYAEYDHGTYRWGKRVGP
jgi:hypothetical protein